jgi:hypothetical protein
MRKKTLSDFLREGVFMKSNLHRMFAVLIVVLMVFSVVACSGNAGGSDKPEAVVADDIVNGDFEDVSSGAWVGWTRKDAAFNFRGVTDVEKVNGAPIEKNGTYFFAGTVGGNPAMRGTLTSDPFKLGGNGFITFKMGGGKNTEKCYVEFFEQGSDKAIAKVVNDECPHEERPPRRSDERILQLAFIGIGLR